jgi:50S ribosomal protein L16 3-hydroxylase
VIVECCDYKYAVLRDWLGSSMTLDGFSVDYLHRMPLARPCTTATACALLDWHALGRILGTPPDDTLVVARGRLLGLPVPRALDEVRGYLRMGVGLCVRHTERRDPVMRGVADAFAELGPSQVQLFVTPGGTHGFGWHYDDEHVFIAQTAGVKDYYFRANTITTAAAAPAEFVGYPRETSTLQTATLVAGDFLYIPARWWHMAVCREDSLSISVGVRISG